MLDVDPDLKFFRFLILSELMIRVTDRRRLPELLPSLPLVVVVVVVEFCWSKDDETFEEASWRPLLVIKLFVSFLSVSLIENPLATPIVAGDFILGVA